VTTTDTTIASIGLPRHATPHALAAAAERVADRLRNHGDAAIAMASVLAARGFAASTLGDGGSRSTDATSSTERAGTRDFRDPWDSIDRSLATALSNLDRAATEADRLLADILSHAEDLDPVPVGTGECQACGRFVRPDRTRPGNRLRAGLCPSDYQAWWRAGRPDRSTWVRTKRAELTDDQGVLHTPEPNHEIDLSRESLA
jgi:hypothetical protein